MVQGLTNIPIKNKIADHISLCKSLSDVSKLVKQVKREMENREAFTGISVETEESVEEVNWRQNNYNQRGRGYNRGNYIGNYHQTMVPKGEVTKMVTTMVIIVVITTQGNRQVTTVWYVR